MAFRRRRRKIAKILKVPSDAVDRYLRHLQTRGYDVSILELWASDANLALADLREAAEDGDPQLAQMILRTNKQLAAGPEAVARTALAWVMAGQVSQAVDDLRGVPAEQLESVRKELDAVARRAKRRNQAFLAKSAELCLQLQDAGKPAGKRDQSQDEVQAEA